MNLGPGTDRRLVGGRPENQAKTPELTQVPHLVVREKFSEKYFSQKWMPQQL
jgi:hypothetical protein